jgi:hypothetical protein
MAIQSMISLAVPVVVIPGSSTSCRPDPPTGLPVSGPAPETVISLGERKALSMLLMQSTIGSSPPKTNYDGQGAEHSVRCGSRAELMLAGGASSGLMSSRRHLHPRRIAVQAIHCPKAHRPRSTLEHPALWGRCCRPSSVLGSQHHLHGLGHSFVAILVSRASTREVSEWAGHKSCVHPDPIRRPL